MKKIFPVVFCICISVVCMTAGMYFHAKGNDFLRNLTIQAKEESFPVSWLQGEQTEEDEIEAAGPDTKKSVSFAAWTELENQSLLGSLGKAGCQADVITVYGSSFCLLPFGKNLSVRDRKGCIIGKELAEELFGSHQAEGQELIWRNHTWTVRGVVEEPSRLCMVEAAKFAKEIDFDRISIVLGQKEDKKLAGEDFINRNGLSANVLRWDYLYQIEGFIDMIPGKWSDFDGWRGNISEYTRMRKLVENAKKTVIEASGLRYQKKGNRLFMLGIILMLCTICAMMYTQNMQGQIYKRKIYQQQACSGKGDYEHSV